MNGQQFSVAALYYVPEPLYSHYHALSVRRPRGEVRCAISDCFLSFSSSHFTSSHLPPPLQGLHTTHVVLLPCIFRAVCGSTLVRRPITSPPPSVNLCRLSFPATWSGGRAAGALRAGSGPLCTKQIHGSIFPHKCD